MQIALTGGTGFVGSHLVEYLQNEGHELVLLARGRDEPNAELLDREGVTFVQGSVTDTATLEEAFTNCDSVAHLAGINFERGDQTYAAVHVEGTRSVIDAATAAGVDRLTLMSYLRARPGTGCGYHESKWRAEELVRNAPIDSTVLKAGVLYGPGDRMLWAIARALATAPLFPRIGFEKRELRPVAIADLIAILGPATTGKAVTDTTVPVVGPETVTVTELVKRVGAVMNRRPWFVPAPVPLLATGATLQEWLLATPLITRASLRMLIEGTTEPVPAEVCDEVPAHLEPDREPTRDRIAKGLESPSRLGPGDLRWPA